MEPHWRTVFRISNNRKEVLEQVPDERIVWESTNGKETRGSVSFTPARDTRSTVSLTMTYAPEGVRQKVGSAAGLDARRDRGDLDRFKQLIESRETGSLPRRSSTSMGARWQSRGRRIPAPIDRLAEAIGATIEIGARHDLTAVSWGHAGDGNLHSTFLVSHESEADVAAAEQAAIELFELALRLGGTIWGSTGAGSSSRATATGRRVSASCMRR